MGKVRQLAQLYLRGSIVNETIKHLTAEERGKVAELVITLLHDPVLAGHRTEFIYQLGATISCDYNHRGGRQSAEQEYQVALWRAAAYLLYHRDYEYICDNCKRNNYRGKNGKTIKIDRRFVVCPNCEHTLTLSGFVHKDTVTDEDHTSPIRPLAGKRKVSDPEGVLKDPMQRKHLIGEFIFNYFRQILNENAIPSHGKTMKEVSGSADILIFQAIIGLLIEFKIPHRYDQSAKNGRYTIDMETLTTPPEFTANLHRLVDKLDGLDIIKYECNRISIQEMRGDYKVITLNIASLEEVQMVGSTVKANNQDEPNIESTDLGEQHDLEDNGCAVIDDNDFLETVRDSLGERSKNVFDLIIGHGVLWDKFKTVYPDVGQKTPIPPVNKIAEFLHCTPKDIQECKLEIRVKYLGQKALC